MSRQIKGRSLMPKITKSMQNLEEYKLLIKEENYPKVQNSKIKKININSKKPGTSVIQKKPNFIFPKIITTNSSTATANNYISNVEPFSLHKFNTKVFKRNKILYKETDFEENQENMKNNNMLILEKKIENKLINRKNSYKIINKKKTVKNNIAEDINKFKDISINLIMNNNEINRIFGKLYRNDAIAIKNWVEKHLFGREIFKIKIEAYIKNKMDIPSFIKNEIYKILCNQYYDYIFSESYKQITLKFDQHSKQIDNIHF